MQKNQYKKYKQILKIRDAVIVAVLVFVGLFYCFGLSGDGENEAQMYRAETVRREEGTGADSGMMQGETTAQEAAVSVDAANVTAAETAAPDAGNKAEAAQPTAAENTGAAAVTAAAAETAGADDRINLNTAGLEELDSLPGIGPATAKLILEYRQQYGGFAAPEEIMNVKRIGEKTYEKLKDRIRV